MNEQNKCPVMHGGIKHTTFGVRSNRDWWPNQLNLKILHQNSALSNPMGPAFNYAEAFKTVDLDVLRQEIFALMTDSMNGGQRIMVITDRSSSAWPGTAPAPIAPVTAAAARCRHAALRTAQQLARQRQPGQGAPLLWPIKQKYGRSSPGPT